LELQLKTVRTSPEQGSEDLEGLLLGFLTVVLFSLDEKEMPDNLVVSGLPVLFLGGLNQVNDETEVLGRFVL
jgi:hypothetical protein